MDGLDVPRALAFLGVLVLVLAAGLAYWLGRGTVDGEADPYQSRPRPDDQGRGDWRSSR